MGSSSFLSSGELNHRGCEAGIVQEQSGRCMGIGGDVLQRCGSLSLFSHGNKRLIYSKSRLVILVARKNFDVMGHGQNALDARLDSSHAIMLTSVSRSAAVQEAPCKTLQAHWASLVATTWARTILVIRNHRELPMARWVFFLPW